MRKRWLAALLLLAGCSSLNERLEGRIDYKGTATLPPLEIPPDLTSPSRDNRYVVPEQKAATTFSDYQAERGRGPRAGATAVLPVVEDMRIERAGTQRWLVVQQPPEKVWPMVKEFWQEAGFLLTLEAPEAGVMETDWAENRAKIPGGVVRDLLGSFIEGAYSSGERDKYRTRLERTADGKGTEVFVSHRGMVEVYTRTREAQSNDPGPTAWQPREPDPELEAEFLRRLMVRLGAQEERARQLIASGQPLQRAELKKGNAGTEVLQVLEPFDRAWRRVGLALDRVGFTVEDRDRQKGIYFVRYADPEAEMSAKDRGILTRIGSLFSTDSKVKAEQYRVQVSHAGTEAEVTVLNKEGAPERSRTGSRILTLLHEQLK